MDDKVLVAGVQMDIEIKEKQHNLAKALSSCEEASRHNARIVIFPELTLTGYAYADVHEIASVSEPVPAIRRQRSAAGAGDSGPRRCAGAAIRCVP